MNVLVINCGSSSLKYQLINSDTEAVLAKGLCERIGIDGRLVYQKAGCDKEITEAAMPTHKEAIQMVLDALTNDKTGAIGSLKEVNAIGHRVVHGGEKFASSAVITDEMIKAVEECNDLAPLHNPANLIGIRVCADLMPGVPQVAVFDTAFHQTMPAKAYLYGLPLDFYKKYKVRRYGFHGTSHSFVSKRAYNFLTYRDCVLADTCCEDDRVNTVHCCNISAYEFSDTVAENVDCVCCIFVSTLSCLVKVTEVAGKSAGKSEKTGFLVEYVHNALDIKVLFLGDELHDSRIDVTGTCSHNNTFKWCKTHCGIYTFTVYNSADRGSVSKVANDNF